MDKNAQLIVQLHAEIRALQHENLMLRGELDNDEDDDTRPIQEEEEEEEVEVAKGRNGAVGKGQVCCAYVLRRTCYHHPMWVVFVGTSFVCTFCRHRLVREGEASTKTPPISTSPLISSTTTLTWYVAVAMVCLPLFT